MLAESRRHQDKTEVELLTSISNEFHAVSRQRERRRERGRRKARFRAQCIAATVEAQAEFQHRSRVRFHAWMRVLLHLCRLFGKKRNEECVFVGIPARQKEILIRLRFRDRSSTAQFLDSCPFSSSGCTKCSLIGLLPI